MSYFFLEHSTDTSEVGHVSWGQLDLITPYNADELLDKNINIKIQCQQKKRAKLTDLVSCFKLGIGNNYIISQRMRVLLETFYLQPHSFSTCCIEKVDGSFVEYNVLHFNDNFFSQAVDFNRSVFRVADSCTFPLTGEEPIVHVTGYLDYMSKKEDLALKLLELRAERIVVDEHFNKKYDMLSFYPFDEHTYISEKLRNVLINEQVSGVKLTETFKLQE